jgi:3-oxoacyl-[acyl-carrier protein] reductase
MLNGKVAIVTGAGVGIGLAIAQELKLRGAKVVRAYRSAEKIELIDENELVVPSDISKSASCDLLIATAIEKFGKIDILVNNAGITKDNLLIRMKDEDIDAVLDTNLKGAFYCTRAAAKIMIKQRSGAIINISSIIGQIGNSGQSNYAASKAGLIGFTKSMAKELSSRNIRVNAVAPGFITTRMTDDLSDDIKKQMLSMIPLGRFGEPKDIANAVAFLSSEEAGFITGQVLRVDGGMVI